MFRDKLVELPDYGRLIVVSDLHGNFTDYRRYLKIWDRDDEDCHIVFTGDMIHAMEGEDGSVEIIEDAMVKSQKYSNFHCLLGNHEWCHITGEDIYKAGVNLRRDFENLVSYRKGYIEPSLTSYIRFFKTMPYFLKTSNGLFISHSGPSRHITTIQDFHDIFREDYSSGKLYGFLWNRYAARHNGYTIADIDSFLEVVGSRFMVVGHTVVDSGYKIIGNQMVLSSSFYTSSKSYLDIDLSKEYESIGGLVEDVRLFDG